MEQIKTKFIDFITIRPWLSLCVFVLIWFASIINLPDIFMDFSPRRWFQQDSQIIKDLDDFEQKFQSDESIVIAIHHPENVLNAQSLKVTKEIHDLLWMVPTVSRVQSLFNSPEIKGVGDEIRMDPIIADEFSYNEQEITDLNKFFESYDDLDGYLISENRKFTVIGSSLALSTTKLSPQELVGKLRDLLDEVELGNSKIFVYGTIVTQEEFRELSQADNTYLIPLVFLIITFLMFYLYRSWFAIFGVFIMMFTTVTWAGGLLSFLQWPYSSLLAAIPGILMAICIADSIHIIESLYKNIEKGLEYKDALRTALYRNFSSTFLTSFTTFVGFISLTLADIIPIFHLGVLTGFAALIAWLFTYLGLGAIYQLFGEKFVKPRKLKPAKLFKSERYINWIQGRKIPIYSFFIFCFFGFLYFSFQNQVDSDPLSYFSKNTEFKQDIDFVFDSLKAKNTLSLEIDSGQVDGVKSVEFFKKMDRFNDYLIELPEVLYTDSILDDLKKLNQAANGGKDEFFAVPQSDRTISELLFFYSLGLPEGVELNFKVSSDYRYLRLMNLVSMTQTSEASKMTKKILSKAKSLGIKAKLGGAYSIYLNINDMVVDAFIKSILSALVIIFFIVLFTYRSLPIALISFIPNVYSLLTTGFLIKVCGMYLDIGTSIVSAICLGISIDDTIHFISHYSENFKRTKDVRKSLILCLDHVGSALIVTTIILTLSFLCFILAGFVPSRNFGILTAATLVFALVADLVLLPAILLFKKK